jgi:hypothetical protein
MSTEQQRTANRANAQLSTGPRTEPGKSRSSLNALKTGLTGRTVVLPSEDLDAYHRHLQHFFDFHKPVGDEETATVQRLADTQWRLDRCATLEHNLYALGQHEFAALFPDESPEIRRALLQAHTFRAYQKEFRNLNIQEGRLQRAYEAEYQYLFNLQSARRQREKAHAKRQANLEKAANLYAQALRDNTCFDPAHFGFEFSIEELSMYLAYRQPPQAA